MNTPARQVTVVVTGCDDAAHLPDAVRSALAQGPVVAEVIAAVDGSPAGIARALAHLAAGEPRLRVAGRGRNDGIEAAASPYLMFLGGGDVLPAGAVQALLAAAGEHGADVTAGLCLTRELPAGRETPWRPELHRRAATVARPADDPRLADDTLCVNKLYRTDFLRDHAITFPDRRSRHPDLVFTARVLAAVPRVALIPEPVCVRRSPVALERPGIDEWRSLIEAHRQVVAIHREMGTTGSRALVRAARAGFLDRSVRGHVADLASRPAAWRGEWWRLTREYLAGFDHGDLLAAPLPARVVGQVVLAAAEPRDLARLAALGARPPRLLPPYAEGVWSADLPQVGLADLAVCRIGELPLAVEASLEPGMTRTRLRLRIHDLCGRLAAARPLAADVAFLERGSGEQLQRRTAALTADGDGWRAETVLDLPALAARAPAVRDLSVTLHCAGGESVVTTPQASPAGIRRTVIPTLRHGLLLVQPHATVDGALALRLTPALRGALSAILRRRGR